MSLQKNNWLFKIIIIIISYFKEILQHRKENKILIQNDIGMSVPSISNQYDPDSSLSTAHCIFVCMHVNARKTCESLSYAGMQL